MLWRERIMWIGLALALAAAARMYSNKHDGAVDAQISMMTHLIHAQQDVLKIQNDAVKAAERAATVAAQGRNDCAQSLEALHEHRRYMAERLGLKDSFSEVGK